MSIKNNRTFWQQRYIIYDLLYVVIHELSWDNRNLSVARDDECRYIYVWDDNFESRISMLYTFCYDLVGINIRKGPRKFIQYVKDKLQ